MYLYDYSKHNYLVQVHVLRFDFADSIKRWPIYPCVNFHVVDTLQKLSITMQIFGDVQRLFMFYVLKKKFQVLLFQMYSCNKYLSK